MLTKHQLKKIESFAKQEYSQLNWMHVQGIRKIAKKIVQKEYANNEIVDLSVLFHDIAKKNLKKELFHHIEGAKIARKFLKKLKINKKIIDQVCHCVLTHSTPLKYFRDKAKKLHKPKNFLPQPKTIEAKVLFDSDMLQQFSPFGLTKSFYFNYQVYNKDFVKGFKDSKDTLLNDAYKALFTKTAKKMAKGRIIYIKNYFKWLERCD